MVKADQPVQQMQRPNNPMGGMMNPMMGMNPMAAAMGGMGMNPMAAMGMNPMLAMSMAMSQGGAGGMGGMNPMAAMAAMSMGGMGGMGGMMAPMMAMQNMAAANRSMAANTQDTEDAEEREAAMAKTLSQSLRAGAASSEETIVSAGMAGGGAAARSNVLHLAYRPTNSESIHGVTDKRFDGKIKAFNERDGYGFVCSEDFEEVWVGKGHQKIDIFLHRNQKGPYEQGDIVSFGIFMNFRGRPQATDLRPAKNPPGMY